MYADTDFLLALIKDDDWLSESAEEIYSQNKEQIWTSRYVILEIFLVSYREDWDTRKVLANTEELVEIRDSIEELFKASIKVEEDNMTPIDAVNLIVSGDDKIISSDESYDKLSERKPLEEK